MAALTITRPNRGTVRREYDPSDTAELAAVKLEFDGAAPGNLATVTKDGKSETIPRGTEFPEGEVEVNVHPQYSGG